MIADTPHSPGVHAASRSARHVKWIAKDMVTTMSKSCYGGLDEGNLSNAPAIHRASQYKKGRHFNYPQILLIWVMLFICRKQLYRRQLTSWSWNTKRIVEMFHCPLPGSQQKFGKVHGLALAIAACPGEILQNPLG